MTLLKNNDVECANSPNRLRMGTGHLKVARPKYTLDAVFDPFIVLYAFYRMCDAWGK